MRLRQTEFKGYDTQAMEREFEQLVEYYIKKGKSEEEAIEIAKFFVDYYSHHFRIYV